MSDTNNSDDDAIVLSSDTFTALQSFYTEQDQRDQERSDAAAVAAQAGDIDFSKLSFDEDWQLSQFWYDDATAEAFARESVRVAGENGRIACVSCPTLYIALKKHFPERKNITLFEYDKRFQKFGSEFTFFDYKSPLDIPRELRESFDLVFADPPFLSDECLTKTAVTIKFLAKEKIILCTGAIMQQLSKRLLDLRMAEFRPGHRNNLANEFRCFSNYDLDEHIVKKETEAKEEKKET